MHDGRVSSSSIIICAMKMIIVIGSDSSDISIAVMVCRSCKWLVSFPVEQLGVFCEDRVLYHRTMDRLPDTWNSTRKICCKLKKNMTIMYLRAFVEGKWNK